MKLEISRQIFENSHISNFMKIRPVEAELFMHGRTDVETDMAILMVVCINFQYAPQCGP